jgi:hypothetical protein
MDASNSRLGAQEGRQAWQECQQGRRQECQQGRNASKAGMPARQECQQNRNASKAGMPAREEYQQCRNASKSKDINERKCVKDYMTSYPDRSGMFRRAYLD